MTDEWEGRAAPTSESTIIIAWRDRRYDRPDSGNYPPLRKRFVDSVLKRQTHFTLCLGWSGKCPLLAIIGSWWAGHEMEPLKPDFLVFPEPQLCFSGRTQWWLEIGEWESARWDARRSSMDWTMGTLLVGY